MSNDDQLIEMARALGRIEADVAIVKADVADLKAQPAKKRAQRIGYGFAALAALIGVANLGFVALKALGKLP